MGLHCTCNALLQDCEISIAKALEIPPCCTGLQFVPIYVSDNKPPPGYTWHQSDDEVTVTFSIPSNISQDSPSICTNLCFRQQASPRLHLASEWWRGDRHLLDSLQCLQDSPSICTNLCFRQQTSPWLHLASDWWRGDRHFLDSLQYLQDRRVVQAGYGSCRAGCQERAHATQGTAVWQSERRWEHMDHTR